MIEQTRKEVDGYELRIDLLEKMSIPEIEKIRDATHLPIIFTWKDPLYNKSVIQSLARLQPDFFDFEYTTPLSIIKDVLSISPATKIIVSIHDYTQTPEDLESLLTQVISLPANIYKIATFAKTILDALHMMQFMLKYSQRYSLIGICMGNAGQLTRLAAPIIGSAMHYCYSGIANTLGQFSLEELLYIYFYKRIGRNTQILALIGNPVYHSPAHYTHNRIFYELRLPLLYVKLHLELEELTNFCRLIKNLPFLGCSVTMPFKEAVIPLLDITTGVVDVTQSANTIHIKKNTLFGYNFDASAALDAIEEIISVREQHIVILGGGGTAKSIAIEAKRRGARITVLNRSVEKITRFANELQIRYGSLHNFEEVAQSGYDIVCNATCLGMGGQTEIPIPPHQLLADRCVMDVVFSTKHTPFTFAAAALNCSIIHGKTMFVKQAIYQMRTWISQNLDWNAIENRMKQHHSLIS